MISNQGQWIQDAEWTRRYFERTMGIAVRHRNFTIRKALSFGLGTRECGRFLSANQHAVEQGSEGINSPWVLPYLKVVR